VISIIDRYIVKKFMLFFTGGLTFFVIIFLAFDLLRMTMKFDVESGILIRYYSYYTPSIIYLLSPLSCLVATVATLSSLNKSQELTVLFSVGMSLARVSLPIFTMVSLITGFNFWLRDRIIPELNHKKAFVYYVEMRKKPSLYSAVKVNKIWYRSKNILFHIKTLNAKKSTAQGLSLYYFDSDWNLVQLIVAKTVHMEGTTWNLKEGLVTLFTKENSFPLTKSFDHKIIEMDEDVADLQSTESSSRVMSLSSLSRFIAKNKEAGLDTIHYEVDFHNRISFPFGALVLSLIGLPFSVTWQRSGKGSFNVPLCIILAFLYWALSSSSTSLGRQGVFSPLVAAWVTNLLMGTGSVVLFLRLRR